MSMRKNKNAQIWIESVLYTLIGISLIGLILAFVMPKISEEKDILIIEQTAETLKSIDQRIVSVLESGEGNIRRIELTIKKGTLNLNPSTDEIYFLIKDLAEPYSEPGVDINEGRLIIRTETEGKSNNVKIILNYRGLADLSMLDSEDNLEIFPANTPYILLIENKGINTEKTPIIEIKKS